MNKNDAVAVESQEIINETDAMSGEIKETIINYARKAKKN